MQYPRFGCTGADLIIRAPIGRYRSAPTDPFQPYNHHVEETKVLHDEMVPLIERKGGEMQSLGGLEGQKTCSWMPAEHVSWQPPWCG